MSSTFFTGLISDNIEDQKKIISYLYNKKQKIDSLYIEYFTDSLCSKLYVEMIKHIENKEDFNLEKLYYAIRTRIIKKEYIEEIINTAYDENNIHVYIDELKKSFIQKKVLSHLDKIATKALVSEFIDVNDIKEDCHKIIQDSFTLDRSDELLTSEQLMDIYEKELSRRKQGDKKRSLGYDNIDKIIKRPAEPGEMTVILGNKGSGKSITLKTFENSLINQKICVLSVNLEMTEVSNADRLISMRGGIGLDDLISGNKSQEQEEHLNRTIQKLKNNKHYLYFKGTEINLDQLESLIISAKKHFKKIGVLPEDEYLVLTVDLLDMVDEFSNAKGAYELKEAANRLHRIYRKHNIHVIPLVQSNENIIRGGKRFKDPEDCEKFTLQPEDIEGASVYGARARVILAINRPLLLKRRFFPERNEEWDLETDVLYVNCVKQNDGKLDRCAFIFNDESFRLSPYEIRKEQKEIVK